MKEDWLRHAQRIMLEPEDFYAGGNRKIRRNLTLRWDNIQNDLDMADAGYTKSKMTMLRRNYLHQESIDAALQLWAKRSTQKGYGSVGFTCYAHFIKGGSVDQARSRRASVFGPCIQSVVLAAMPDKTVEVSVFYRTTELFKKFPADLVFLRDELLSQFPIDQYAGITFHFASVTIHPMYFVTIVPHLDDPIRLLRRLKRKDPRYYSWIVKATSRYLLPEHFRGIEKFSQALRVKMDVDKRIIGPVREELVDYLRENHPGHRRSYP